MVNELEWIWIIVGFGFIFFVMVCGVSGYLLFIIIKNWGIVKIFFVGLCLLIVGFFILYVIYILVIYFLGCILVGMGYIFVGVISGMYIIIYFFVKCLMVFGFYYIMGGFGGVVGFFIVWLVNDVLGNW